MKIISVFFIVLLSACSQNNSNQAELGKKLFFDTNLSMDKKVSCASCHIPEKKFTDGKIVSTGFKDKKVLRNSMSLLNVGEQETFFWDGRATKLEEQVLVPFLNSSEHAFTNKEQLLSNLNANDQYVKLFKETYSNNNEITIENLATALSAYVRTLKSPESAIDRFILKKDSTALSKEAQAGFAVFNKAQCMTCHSITPDKKTGLILLTDHDFHAHSATFYGMHQVLDQKAVMLLSEKRKLTDVARDSPNEVEALGRFMVTGKISDVGAFKTPSLRNVALTGLTFTVVWLTH